MVPVSKHIIKFPFKGDGDYIFELKYVAKYTTIAAPWRQL